MTRKVGFVANEPSAVERRILIYPPWFVRPEDLITFIRLRSFASAWRQYELTENDLRELETSLMANPQSGSIVPGTGGLRRLRVVPDTWDVGTRGALRVSYVYFENIFVVVLVAAYDKSRKEHLTIQEMIAMRKLIPQIYKKLSRVRKNKKDT
jgi:hypothetical protein